MDTSVTQCDSSASAQVKLEAGRSPGRQRGDRDLKMPEISLTQQGFPGGTSGKEATCQ